MKHKSTLRQIFCSAILLSVTFSVNAQVPVRKVLIEEFTTASCGNCPMMSAHINNWHNANAGSSILMSIHEGSGVDAMSNASTAAIFNAMHPTGSWFAPAVMIDRGVYPSTGGEAYLSCYLSWGSAPNPGVDSIATRLMNEPAVVGVDISGTYNATTRTINATVDAKFVSAVPSGDWRINLFLVEDSVIGYPNLGPFLGWDQHCYDSNWANSNYPGMFDGTSIIGYPHRHVMRKPLLGNWGAQSIIPAVPVIGTTYSASGSLVVDTAYHDNHLTLVAFVSSYGSSKTEKFILNANEVELTPSFTTGIETIDQQNGSQVSIDNVYPMPSNGETKINFTLAKNSDVTVSIYNTFGQAVEILTESNQNAGSHEITFDASKFSSGIYYITLQTPADIKTKKFIVD